MNSSLYQSLTNYDRELDTHDLHCHLGSHFPLAWDLVVYQEDHGHIQHLVEGHFLGGLEAYFYY